MTIPNRSVILRVADEISVALERHFWHYAALFGIVLLASAIVQDVRAKMWIDELYTLHMSQQASPGEIVRATLEGCDGAPPLYAIIVRAILPWVPHQALAVRLPATLGFCGMAICLLAFCRRRLPAVYAFVAALLACDTCRYYSTEGRGYGVALGCAAGALLCWQTAADGKRRVLAIPLLAFCLALMTAMHYYSVFFLAPLFLAEMVRWRMSGKLDIAILASVVPVLLVLGLHYPLIAAGKRFQEYYWSPAVLRSIPELYSGYFNVAQKCMLLAVGLLAVFSTTPDRRSARQAGLTLFEWVATGSLLLMPLCVVVLSRYTTHVFVDRYTLWAVTGIAVMVTALLCAAARGKTAVGVGVLGLLAVGFAWHQVNVLRKMPVLREGEAVRQELVRLPDSSEPIVIADHHVFMELSYYSAPRLRERLIYPLSRDLDLRYVGYDTGSLLMSALSHRTKLPVFAYDAVLAAHPRFVLAATSKNYLPWHLVRAGYSVIPIGSSKAPVLYEVEAPGGKGSGSLTWEP